jgi:hypothetical protein
MCYVNKIFIPNIDVDDIHWLSHVYLFVFFESGAEEQYYCLVTMQTCCRI